MLKYDYTFRGKLVMNHQNTIISTKVLSQNNKLIDARIDFNQSKFIYIKGDTYSLNNLVSINKIGTYTKDLSKLAFIITTTVVGFISIAFMHNFLTFLYSILSTFIISLLVAYSYKLFRIHSSLYRVYLNNEPINLLLTDLDAYTLKEFMNIKETA